jgi:Protein of unknown function (DUF3800)
MATIPPFIDPSKRYRLFFDETGNSDLYAGKKDPHQRYLSLTGLVIRQDIHDGAITRRLTVLKTEIFGQNNAAVILHRREIMNREGVFGVLDNDELRAKFDAKFCDLVGTLPATAFTVSIDKQAHLEKYARWQWNPYHYVMTCLLERFVLWLNATGNVGDVMGEARNPTHDAQLRRAFRFFYKNGSFVRVNVIRRCLVSSELKLEIKSANVAALQIADSLAHPAHRNYKLTKIGEAIPNDYGSSLVAILENSKYNRKPSDGIVEGYGRKWLP